jgi:hypothetical protein
VGIAASVLALPIPLPDLAWHSVLARPWSAFALALHFPPELLELAAGMTGLAVFLRVDPASETLAAEAKPIREEGDGTSRVWDYGFRALVGAWLVAAFHWWTWFREEHNLEPPGMARGFHPASRAWPHRHKLALREEAAPPSRRPVSVGRSKGPLEI